MKVDGGGMREKDFSIFILVLKRVKCYASWNSSWNESQSWTFLRSIVLESLHGSDEAGFRLLVCFPCAPALRSLLFLFFILTCIAEGCRKSGFPGDRLRDWAGRLRTTARGSRQPGLAERGRAVMRLWRRAQPIAWGNSGPWSFSAEAAGRRVVHCIPHNYPPLAAGCLPGRGQDLQQGRSL